MSNQFRYLLSGEQVVSTLLRQFGPDEAMERAVGGDFERFGVLEHALLREAGLGPTSSVVDVGCGSGRLAAQLARLSELRYLGTDTVPALLEYARQRVGRPDFRFIHVDRVALPTPDASVDLVAFFSVLTHLLHEESYLYLQEAHRVLRPGGKVVFSFVEFDTPTGWTVFEANLDWVRSRVVASQLNIFLNRADIRLWARRIGFRVDLLRTGEPGSVTVGPGEATEAVPAGAYAFGQSVCVLRKPGLDEAGDETEAESRRQDGPGAGRARPSVARDPAARDARRRERKARRRGDAGTAEANASGAAEDGAAPDRPGGGADDDHR
jgi:SAM-dependent methyltransferase